MTLFSKKFKVVHKKGNRACNLWILTLGKTPWFKNKLKYDIEFTDSCKYKPLPSGETSSWNKLIYIGKLDPHIKGANFGWRYFEGKLQLSARLYDNDSGDDLDHVVLWEKDIQLNTRYTLEVNVSNNKTIWYVDGLKVAEYHEDVDNDCLSAPWFGGGPGLAWQGNVPQQKIAFYIWI